jgi:hypothetical protein
MNDAANTLRLVRAYQSAFGVSNDGEVDEAHKPIIEDMEQFCGLRQAKFEGDSHEIIKAMGRVEMLGRIKFFLEYRDVSKLQEYLEDDGDE